MILKRSNNLTELSVLQTITYYEPYFDVLHNVLDKQLDNVLHRKTYYIPIVPPLAHPSQKT
jgi:hypothetical protein